MRFWNWVRDQTGEGTRTLHLEGTIAEESWFDDDVTPAAFKNELMVGAGPVTIWINSPGGDVFAAAQIYNMLMDYPGDVTVKIDGIAASAASNVAMILLLSTRRILPFHASMVRSIRFMHRSTARTASLLPNFSCSRALPDIPATRTICRGEWMVTAVI